MTRAQRRYNHGKAKGRAAAVAKMNGTTLTPRQVGIQAAMHNTCACLMCTTKDPDDRTDTRTAFRDLLKLTNE